MNQMSLKKIILASTYVFFLILLLLHFKTVISFFFKIFTAVTPFIYGICIAYVINWIYMFFYRRILVKEKHRKLFSILFAYLLTIIFIIFMIMIVIPQVINSITNIVNKCIVMFPVWQEYLEDLFNGSFLDDAISKFTSKWDSYLSTVATPVLNFTKNFAVSMYNCIIGFIVSIYFVLEKEKLLSYFKRILKVFMTEKWYNEVIDASLSFHNVFGQFLKGKLLSTAIVGVICFIAIVCMKLPYAMLISVIVSITNIIPFFGPIIGAVPCITILLVENPLQALYFTIFFSILMVVDANFISPKIIGNKVGISSLFMIFSVIVGGSLFGFLGMVLGVPVFAVIYNIITRLVRKGEKTSDKTSKKINIR